MYLKRSTKILHKQVPESVESCSSRISVAKKYNIIGFNLIESDLEQTLLLSLEED